MTINEKTLPFYKISCISCGVEKIVISLEGLVKIDKDAVKKNKLIIKNENISFIKKIYLCYDVFKKSKSFKKSYYKLKELSKVKKIRLQPTKYLTCDICGRIYYLHKNVYVLSNDINTIIREETNIYGF